MMLPSRLACQFAGNKEDWVAPSPTPNATQAEAIEEEVWLGDLSVAVLKAARLRAPEAAYSLAARGR